MAAAAHRRVCVIARLRASGAPWSFRFRWGAKLTRLETHFREKSCPAARWAPNAQASLAHSVSARRRRSMFVFTSPSSSPRLSTSGAGALRTRRRGAVAT